MRTSTIVMTGFAVLFGVLAMFVAQVWLNKQADKRARSMEVSQAPAVARTVVVAKQPLRFGTVLAPAMLKEVPWPASAVPAGAFAKVGDLLSGGQRVVLTAMEPNEPVLALKITGPGERATLSALVHKGMKAVTIRVNDVDGVGGFVQPGDHVDVVLTRQTNKEAATAQVVLQDARVLAVDQRADERASKATVPKSVTLEVNTRQAQKLWLAASVGNLSLLLRKAGETEETSTRPISLSDLSTGLFGNDGSTTTVMVTRREAQQKYTVPVEDSGATAFAKERMRAAR
ncbi:MAG TPA: Flp pilus assembly protein CpaB [Pseudolabrys sp.]|nr:Flp pilus assembly protein CpaB [Pseudolabrys sp.]